MNPADRIYLARAIELARRGSGNTAPNPAVGAVVVDRDGVTIGEGYHHVRGGPHAEVEALADARARGADAQRLAQATMYVSLEPCNHLGRTPPCSEALIAAGITRAVIGTRDPNPRTAGGGIARLRAAGIVTEIADDPAACAVIAPFAQRMRTGRPFVTVKIAASINGIIAPQYGSYWLTGAAARKHVRALRAAHDAILIGAGTARVDNPQLTLRPPRTRAKPLARVVVGGRTIPDSGLRVFHHEVDGRVLLCVPESIAAAAASAFSGTAQTHVEIVPVAESIPGTVDCRALLSSLHDREITEILCEGGPALAASLLAADCVDRIEWLIAPVLIATDGAVPALGAHGGITRFAKMHAETLGADVLLRADREFEDV